MTRIDELKVLRSALKRGDLQSFNTMIEEDRSRLELYTVFGPWLHEAAIWGKLEFVKYLLDIGVDINRSARDGGGNAIKAAALVGQEDIIVYLLSRGAEMDASTSLANPLFSAIYGNHTAVAKLLIDAGIDTSIRYPNLRNKDALDYAREWGRKEIVALLEAKLGVTAQAPVASAEPAPTQLDFTLIRSLIRDAVRKTIQELKAAHAGEKFYAFTLYSDDSAMIVCPSANTEEQLSSSVIKQKNRHPELWVSENFCRWNPFEWSYVCEGADNFHQAYQAVNVKDLDLSPEFGTFPIFKGRLFATMVLALRDLDIEGVFGTEEAGDRMTVFCCVWDSSLAPWLAVESARVLNPANVFRRFADEWLEESTIRADYEMMLRDGGEIGAAFRRTIAEAS